MAKTNPSGREEFFYIDCLVEDIVQEGFFSFNYMHASNDSH